MKKLERLLEIAAKKQNASADATCVIASYFESGEQLEDDLFDAIFEKVTELARVSLEKKPNYRRAARELLAQVRGRTKHA